MFSLKMRKKEKSRSEFSAADSNLRPSSSLERTHVAGRCRRIFSVFSVFVLIVSCSTTHELPYIADATRDSATVIANTYSSTIHPGDQLYIYVSSQTPESVIPFNQETHAFVAEATKVVNGAESAEGQQRALDQNTLSVTTRGVAGYLVDENGFIVFPVLGRVQAAGFSMDSLASVLQHRLIVQGYVSDPIVTVHLMNFRVAVIGEVKVPMEIHVDGTRLTIFEALAMCGDLTLYGKNNDIKVLREDHGEYTLGQIDLTSRTLLDSPYYYLRQNDIVYVEPNDKRKDQSWKDDAYAKEFNAYVNIGTSGLRAAQMFYSAYIFSRYGR